MLQAFNRGRKTDPFFETKGAAQRGAIADGSTVIAGLHNHYISRRYDKQSLALFRLRQYNYV